MIIHKYNNAKTRTPDNLCPLSCIGLLVSPEALSLTHGVHIPLKMFEIMPYITPHQSSLAAASMFCLCINTSIRRRLREIKTPYLCFQTSLSLAALLSSQLIDDSPFCPKRQTTNGWLLCNLKAMPLGEKATVAWPLRAETLKLQAVIIRHSGHVERAAS